MTDNILPPPVKAKSGDGLSGKQVMDGDDKCLIILSYPSLLVSQIEVLFHQGFRGSVSVDCSSLQGMYASTVTRVEQFVETLGLTIEWFSRPPLHE